jgi:general secretion pathway protein K
MKPMRARQRGVALLVALLVVALAVILIAALLDRGELTLARTRNLLRAEQADAYALGLEQYAAEILLQAQAESPGIDTHASPWALPLPPQPVPGGVIGAQLHDLNGCFNLNNLSPHGAQQAEWMKVFRALLAHRGAPEEIADAVRAWLGDGDSGTNAYLALPVAYRPRGDLFAHASELRLVHGVSGDAYARLAPYVCALPPGTRLNVNTASVPLLWSLGALNPAITEPIARKLWSEGQARHGDLSAFAQAAGTQGWSPPATLLDVQSGYFMASGEVMLDGIPFVFHSLIARDSGLGVRVLARSRGSDDASGGTGSGDIAAAIGP